MIRVLFVSARGGDTLLVINEKTPDTAADFSLSGEDNPSLCGAVKNYKSAPQSAACHRARH